MGANNNISLAVTAALGGVQILCIAAQAANGCNSDRPLCEAVAKGVEVLLRKQRCRHQNDDLLVILNGDKCCAHCDLGFAKANISTNESVHSSLSC